MDCLPTLSAVPLFQGLGDEDLALVAALVTRYRLPAGTPLSRQADLGETFFVLESGEAVVHRVGEDGQRRPVGMLGPGDSYGVTSLFLRQPRDATVTATSEVVLCALRRADLEDLLARYPRLAARLNLPPTLRARLAAPTFAWLEPGEEVVHLTRRHAVVLARGLLRATFGAALYAAALWAVGRLTALDPGPLWALPGLVAYLAALAWYYVDWRNDYLLVTTRRIAHHERVAFLYEARQEAPLDRVQNVNVESGFWGALLGYGDLSVQTAAQVGQLRFTHTPSPEAVREALFAQLARVRATRRAAERRLITEELVQRINQENPHPLPGEELAIAPLEPPAEGAEGAVRPGGAARALSRLGASGLLPPTHYQTSDGDVWRKHWIFLLRGLLGPAVALVLLLALTALGFAGRPAAVIAAVPALPVISLALCAVAVGWGWWNAADWANDQYVVTDDRIVDVEKSPLFFSEQRREATLGVIQNVSLEMPNILAAVLNYGNVLVQTAGQGEFTFHRVAGPREVQQEVFRRLEAYRERQRQREAQTRRAELAEWLTVYDRLRHQSPSPPPP